ncbi:MAG TPA: DNA mismatch repair protein MutL [Thermoanaerobacter sp.]|nr:DNA mismatch repair protein MutL [Thermoanaerobacter sp.]
MNIDVLVAEIGSTTTIVNAFNGVYKSCPEFLGQGIAPTTVENGDVTIGLENAIKDLEQQVEDKIQWGKMMASSSAAGGLKMTVHGLVYDMTVKAAKEAALGAGAIIRMVTAGKITLTDLKKISEIKPNIILLAGGVDYGEKDTAIYNAKKIVELEMDIPIIYAGNIAARDEIGEIFEGKNQVFFVDNVYPRIDELVVEPARKVIQQVFEEHIIKAPGMEKIRTFVDGPIMPTPGAVMNAAKALKEEIGDLLVIDVGGATTDVHSVAENSEEIAKILIAPEPEAKRTVEGDLGVFINRYHVMEIVGYEESTKILGFDAKEALEKLPPIPSTAQEIKLAEYLTQIACKTALERHAGKIKYLFGPASKYAIATGKDLTKVKWVIGTGGALTKLPEGKKILESIRCSKKSEKLLPTVNAKVLIDADYIMASLGVLCSRYPMEGIKLLKKDLSVDETFCT